MNQDSFLKRRRLKFASVFDDETLSYLESHFETDLPCFQGTAGNFDPLDAMRRDAHREVILFIRSEIKASELYKNQ